MMIHSPFWRFGLWAFLSLCTLACTSGKANSDPLHVDGLSAVFQLKTDSVWHVPEPGKRTSVHFALEMTNTSHGPIRFPIMDVDNITVALKDEHQREFHWEGGQDGIIPGKPTSAPVSPGDTFELILATHLDWDPNQRLRVSFEDGLGSIWWIGPLDPGAYQVDMTYENRSARSSDLWQGRANISPVSIQIK
ncbi:MAG: hypothetical protein PVI93_09810 [Desulfobacterales bacterium]